MAETHQLIEWLWAYIQRNDMNRRDVAEMLAMEMPTEILKQLIENLEYEEANVDEGEADVGEGYASSDREDFHSDEGLGSDPPEPFFYE